TPAWCVNGTPADSVKLALSVLLTSPPDLIISGINRGSNAGRNILYSGTVGCAIEGALRGIPSIAFSTYNMHTPKYDEALQYIPTIIEHTLSHPLPNGTLLNVNFPGTESQEGYGKIQGFKMTHQGKEYFLENPDIRHHPVQNSPYYWLGLKRGQFIEQEDCDIKWLQKGYVTAVPLHVSELTDISHMSAKREAFENSLNSKLTTPLKARL
ncbi:MAG: 5'/3'-nucleotidase SurE, partial [Waddliaceae bacterium]